MKNLYLLGKLQQALRYRVFHLPLVGVLLLLLSGCQGYFLYHPQRASERELTRHAEALGFSEWNDTNGDFIGWRPQQERFNAHRLLVFHGNAGFALHRGHYRDTLQTLNENIDVYLLEYPGYGARAGNPSERTILAAAEQAVNSLLAKDEAPIFLLGESIGSGPATHMAGKFQSAIAGVLLITPFNNLPEVARYHFPSFLVRLILRDTFDNSLALQQFHGPLAVVLAENDTVIPARFGETLFNGYAGPKQKWVQKGKGHNNLDLSAAAEWWRDALTFVGLL